VTERQIRSVARVRDLGEVFTPAETVRAMLDLLPERMWAPHPPATFLEPSCGNGNFLAAVLVRKLDAVDAARAAGVLPAGPSDEARLFHGLEALASIYGVDLSPENVLGGADPGEAGARTRMLDAFNAWCAPHDLARAAAAWIVERNLIVGNMLPVDAAGQPSGRDDLPLTTYAFDPPTLGVSVARTTLGEVIAASAPPRGATLSLFAPPKPTVSWSGPALELARAPTHPPTKRRRR
jgi:hypothetical protein